MFSSLHLLHFGPHADLTISLGSRTRLTAPSEAGKSMILEALCFLLWGCDSSGKPLDPAFIRDGADACEVEARTAKGAIFRRRKTRAGTPTRERQLPAEAAPLRYTSEADWRAMLGPIGRPVARIIAAPMAWNAMNPANGHRELRDLIAGLLPRENLQAEIESLAGFPIDVVLSAKEAEAAQTGANAAKEQARGALGALSAPVEVRPVRPEADIAPSRAVLASSTAWDAYDADLRRRQKEREAHDRAVAAYERRRAAIPTEPPAPAAEPDGLAAASRRLADAQAALGRADTAAADHARQAGRWKAALEALRASPGTCPLCGQPHDQTQAIADLQAQEPVAPSTRRAPLQDAVEEAEDALRKVRAAIQASQQQAEARRSWEMACAALGDRPEAPRTARPIEPSEPRPVAGEIAQARKAIEVWGRDNADSAASQRQADRHQVDLDAAKARLAAAEERAQKAGKLLEATKTAPGRIAARQAAALGALGPVSLRWEGMGVEILVDGRPFWLASAGKQIAADLAFRAALRRLAKLEYFPMVVDNRQNWSGELPAINNVIELRTGQGAWTVEAV